MNICIKRNDGDRYTFSVIEEKSDLPGMEYRSDRDFYLVAGVKPHYPTYTKAHSAALRIAEKHPEVVMAKKAAFSMNQLNKENTLIDGFFYFWNSFLTESQLKPSDFRLHAISASRVMGLQKNSSKTPILKICSEYIEAEKEENEKENILDCIRFFAEVSADALNPVHEKIHIRLAEYVPSSDSYDIILGDDEDEICCVKLDNKMLLEDVLPCGKTASVTPYHSRAFFETYFEPVMTAIGHIKLDEVIAVVNHPSSKRRKLAAFSSADNTPKWVKLRIPDSEDSVWGFKVMPPISSQASLKNKQVRCIRPDLPTYYGRTGDAIEEIDRGSYKDVVVDFRRGLGIVVMTDSDIEQI